MGLLKGIGLATASLLAIGAIATVLNPKSAPPKTDAQVAQEAVDVQLGAAVKSLKSGAKDPASFSLDQVLAMADGAGCVTYRATNSFGATVPGQAVVAGGKIVTSDRDGAAFSRAHDKHCGSKSGRDITAYSKQFL